MTDNLLVQAAIGEAEIALALLRSPAPLDPVTRRKRDGARREGVKPRRADSYRMGTGHDRMKDAQPVGCCATTGLLFALCPCENPVPWVIWLRPRKALHV